MKLFKKVRETDVTLKTQIIRILISHIKISFFLLLMFGVFLINLWTLNIARKILCIIVPLIYALSIGAEANKSATHDYKSYSKTKPFALKGFLLPVPILVFSLVFWVIFKFSWIDTQNLISVLVKLIFYMWTFPFTSFAYLDKASMHIACHLLIYLLPFLASGIGYFTGYKKWDLYKLLNSITFEKKQ